MKGMYMPNRTNDKYLPFMKMINTSVMINDLLLAGWLLVGGTFSLLRAFDWTKVCVEQHESSIFLM